MLPHSSPKDFSGETNALTDLADLVDSELVESELVESELVDSQVQPQTTAALLEALGHSPIVTGSGQKLVESDGESADIFTTVWPAKPKRNAPRTQEKVRSS